MEYKGNMTFTTALPHGEDPMFDDITYKCDIGDCRSQGHFTDKTMHNLSLRLLRATKMNPIPRYLIDITVFLA